MNRQIYNKLLSPRSTRLLHTTPKTPTPNPHPTRKVPLIPLSPFFHFPWPKINNKNINNNNNQRTIQTQSSYPEPEKGNHNHNNNQDQNLDREYAFGVAIRTIIDELPMFFEVGLTNTDIYSKDIFLHDPYHYNFNLHGRHWYLTFWFLVRQGLKLYYDDILFDIVKVQQFRGNADRRHDEESSTQVDVDEDDYNDDNNDLHLVVKWVFEGTPRPQQIVPVATSTSSQIAAPPRSLYEGVFVYRFNKEGKISHHYVQSIDPAPPSFMLSKWWNMATGGGGGSSNGAVPGLMNNSPHH